MDHPKFIVSNQKEESISIRRVNYVDKLFIINLLFDNFVISLVFIFLISIQTKMFVMISDPE